MIAFLFSGLVFGPSVIRVDATSTLCAQLTQVHGVMIAFSTKQTFVFAMLEGNNARCNRWEERMTRLVTVAFVVALMSAAQATPLAPVHQPDSIVTTVREACGAGMHRVNGVCIRTAARRHAVRCATGMRVVNGVCVR